MVNALLRVEYDMPNWAPGPGVGMTVAGDLATVSLSLAGPPFPDPPLA